MKQITWFFDVDKTLYAPNNGLYQEGNRRINQFLMQKLKKDFVQVNTLRKYYMKKYGTSLLGSVREHALDAREFLDFVHTFPKEPYLKPQKILRDFLKNLPGPKFIFSNAPQTYIKEILQLLGIQDCFLRIYGIESFRHHGKPTPSAYTNIHRWTKVSIDKSVLIDDMEINCNQAKKMGMNSVWIDEKQMYNDYYKDVFFPAIQNWMERVV